MLGQFFFSVGVIFEPPMKVQRLQWKPLEVMLGHLAAMLDPQKKPNLGLSAKREIF